MIALDLVTSLGSLVVNNSVELLGFILPPVVQILNKDVHTERERFIVSLIICLMSALVVKWNELITGDTEDMMVYAMLIWTESQVIYRMYFKTSAIQQRIQEKLNPVVETSIPPTSVPTSQI